MSGSDSDDHQQGWDLDDDKMPSKKPTSATSGVYAPHRETETSFNTINIPGEFTDPICLKFSEAPSLAIRIKEGMDRVDSCRCKLCVFPARSLRIGSWQREAKHASDITVKCFFTRKLLMWEVILDNALKRKMQINCHCVSAIKATYPEGQPSILEIELTEPPLYFCEIETKRRGPIKWEGCQDFTGGEAPRFKRHTLTFEEGTLKKNYENLLLGCPELYFSSRRSFSSLNSTLFNHLPQSFPLQQCFNNLHLQQSFDASIGFNYSPLPQTPVMGVMGTNSLPVNAIEQSRSAMDAISSQPVKRFGPVDVNNAATSSYMHENSPLESNLNEIGQVASKPGLNWRNNGYSTTPRLYDHTEVKKGQTAEGSKLANGEYRNMLVSPNDHYPKGRQSYPVPNVFNLEKDDLYSLSNLNTHMAPRNLTNRQVAPPENDILMTNGSGQNSEDGEPEVSSSRNQVNYKKG